MKTYYVGTDAIALGLCGSEKYRPELVVKECLSEHGISPWERMETEIFLFPGESLLIARPAAPRRKRVSELCPRLVRR